MGRTQQQIHIYGTTSSHNSDQDGLDESAWEEFVDRVKLIAGEHRYKELYIDVIG